MTERTQKKLIATLLLVSCVISAWLLFITPQNNSKRLKNFAQADSLLRLTLSDFNISNANISTADIQVDSIFRRKKYSVKVPPAFSKTQLHAALQQQLSPYGISLPARVTFPEKDMAIQLYSNGNVIRTVRLVTDNELSMHRSFAHIIAAFKGEPPAYLMETLSSFGEPIPVAIMLRVPLRLPDWWDDFKVDQPGLYIWPQTASGENLLNANQQQITSGLETIRESAPTVTLLHFFDDEQMASATLSKTPFSYIDARDAFILDAEVGRSGFSQAFRAFIRQSRSGDTPLAIVMATEQSLAWIQQELNSFKKGGLTITPPPKNSF